MQAVKNRFGNVNQGSPAEFIEWVNKDYNAASLEMLRIPNCGRQTVKEIFDELGIVPPDGPKIKLVKFETDDELLSFIRDTPDMDVMKLDRNTLQLLLSLVARGLVNVENDHSCKLSALGNGRVDEIRNSQRVELTLSGTRAQFRQFIESLGDNHPYLDCMEDAMRDLDNATRVNTVLSD